MKNLDFRSNQRLPSDLGIGSSKIAKEPPIDSSALGSLLKIFLPILIICVVLGFAQHTMYSIFNVEQFGTALSTENFGDPITEIILDLDNKADTWFSSNSDSFGVGVLQSIYNILTTPVTILLEVFRLFTTATHIAGQVLKSFVSGNYWVHNTIPEDIQQYFYQF